MPDENGDQTVSGGVITGGSFYGKVDNRDRSDFRPMYLGILAGGTFYAGNPGTVANGCCTVTYDYGKADGTYAIQIVNKYEEAVRPADPKLSGFDFGGWLKNGTPYDFDTPVTGDLTLTAGWRKIVPGSGTGTLTITNCINAVTVTGSEAADVIIYPTDGSTGGKSSPTTFDAGIGVCAVTAFTSLTGLALLRRKRRDEE